jgi:uncharacterized protein (UPF0276 family)
MFDYVEVPFEALEHDPALTDRLSGADVVLHCASLSIAGDILPSDQLYKKIEHWVRKTRTPWLGEHLSFSSVSWDKSDGYADEYAPGEPYNIGYTVTPPFNSETFDKVLRSVRLAKRRVSAPLILENSPVYFLAPGSEWSQVDFITRLVAASDVELLLDLAHLLITARNTNENPLELLSRYPLDRVVEVHISGVDTRDETSWDDHAVAAPEVEFQMLSRLLERKTPVAVTLEYNWSAAFPISLLEEEVNRTRRRLGLE